MPTAPQHCNGCNAITTRPTFGPLYDKTGTQRLSKNDIPVSGAFCPDCAVAKGLIEPLEVRIASYKKVPVLTLNDGDAFSIDGEDWYTFAVLLWGCVSVYCDHRRGNNAPCVRIDCEREAEVYVR